MSTEEFQALLADLGWLRTLARRLARDANAAEDLVQDACAIALRQPAPPLQWRAWLTERFLGRWLDGRAYYRIALLLRCELL